MDPTVNMNAYSDALVVLGTAGILVPLLRKWGVNSILGYLCAGALLGPLGLGALASHFKILYWCTITNAHSVEGIAELGIVFLLFRIGIEMSLKRMRRMAVLIVGLGNLQVLLTAALIASVALWKGQRPAAAIILGVSLSLSSTAIVLELLSKQGRMSTSVGRASFAVLLAQDLTVIPLLMFISFAGNGNGSGSAWGTLVSVLLQAAVAVLLIGLLGHFFMRRIFRLVASSHSSELFIAAVLFVVVAAAVAAHAAGLSMALGAFIAGLLLAETEYRKAIQAVAEPFKGILLGIFFFTVGMNINFQEILQKPFWLLGCAFALIFVKAVLLAGLGRLFHLSWPAAVETGMLLGPGGEFAFVGLGMASSLHIIDASAAGFSLAAVSVTMALTPLLSSVARHFGKVLVHSSEQEAPELLARPSVRGKSVIVVGYGRVGQVVCGFFREHHIPYVASDSDPQVVLEGRHDGEEIFYGDASNPEFLLACGLQDTPGLIVTINAHDAIDSIVAIAHTLRPGVPIISRAHDADHARHLYEQGVTSAVPETVEASLQLSEDALIGVGVSAEAAMASVRRQRESYRDQLQGARQPLPETAQ